MTKRNLQVLGVAAVVLLGAGIWLSIHRDQSQANLGGGLVFSDLRAALGDIGEIRLSRGDGSKTTLKKTASGWTVVERNFPADSQRVRELALNLASLKVIETKTSDPANYPKLGVEAPDKPTATSTLVEVVAGQKTWELLVGKGAEGRSIYIRKPKEAASALAEPALGADPDQKRWVDRLLTDLPGAEVHEIEVKAGTGPGYLLTRAQRGDTGLALSPVPKGRTPVNSMSLDGQAEALTAFNFDDLRALPSPAPAATDHATYRTFDGQVIEFGGHREGDKGYVTVAAHRDAALAAKFPAPPEQAATGGKPAVAKPAAAKPSEHTAERLAARTSGLEFEIPLYKYESMFKPLEDLLEKPPAPASPAGKSPAKPAAASPFKKKP
jgi:hypothetical protein